MFTQWYNDSKNNEVSGVGEMDVRSLGEIFSGANTDILKTINSSVIM